MIIPCDRQGTLMRCFEPGEESALIVPANQPFEPVTPPLTGPVDFSLWMGRNDAVGAAAAASPQGGDAAAAAGAFQWGAATAPPAQRGAAAAASSQPGAASVARYRKQERSLDLRRGVSHELESYTARPNLYTTCLYREQAMWREIESRGGLRGLCCPSMPAGEMPPWVSMPASGRRFQQIGSIPRPAVEGVDTLVATLNVPTGFDGVIVSVVSMFTGAGFVEGSGDIHYRIQINRRWLKDYGDIQTTLGTVASPCMIYRGGVRLRTQEVCRYWVQLGPGALGRLDPLGRFVCAFFGWFYPQV